MNSVDMQRIVTLIISINCAADSPIITIRLFNTNVISFMDAFDVNRNEKYDWRFQFCGLKATNEKLGTEFLPAASEFLGISR